MVWMMKNKRGKKSGVDNWLYYINILKRNKTGE
jgi:hypothetical protein